MALLKLSETDPADLVHAGDRDVGDVGRGDGARGVRDATDLPRGVGLDGDVVGGALGQGGAEGEGAVGAGAQVVAGVVLEDRGAGEPGDGAPDRVGGHDRGHAGDRDVGDVGRGDGARGVRDRADLPRRVGLDGDVVGGALGQGGAEGEGAVGAGAQVVAGVVLEDRGAGEPGDGAPDRVGGARRGHAGDRDVGDVGRGHGARGVRRRYRSARRVGLDGDVVGGALGQLGAEGEGAVGAGAQVVAGVVLEDRGSGEPAMVPPTEKVGCGVVTQVTETLVTLAVPRWCPRGSRRSGLARGVGLDGDVVGGALGQRGAEGERAVGAGAQVVAGVVLEDHGSGEPGDGAPDREGGAVGSRR